MKLLCLIIVFFAFSFSAFGQTNTKTLLSQARTAVASLQVELNGAKDENLHLQQSLANANQKVLNAESEVKTVQKHADNLRDWGVDQQTEAAKWFDAHVQEKKAKEAAIKRYHFSKTINSVTAAILLAIFGLWAMRFVPPIYAGYAFLLPVAGAIIGATLTWMLL